jgi:membrane-associated phospholipid phosphatase
MRTFAFFLSVALHPLLVPTYLVALLCYGFVPGSTGLSVAADKAILLLQVWGLTFWLPGLLCWLLYKAGYISSVELYERRQRPLPLLIAALSFAAATWRVAQLPHGSLLVTVLNAMTIAVLLTLCITLRWKISAHGVGMGGAVGLLLWLRLALPYSTAPAAVTPWLLTGLGLAAAVAWARLALRAHTPAQILAGLGLGTAVALLAGWA